MNAGREKRALVLRAVPLMIFLGIAIQISFSYILNFILSANAQAAGEYDHIIAPLLSMDPKMILRVCLAAPVLEELMFRGAVFGFFRMLGERILYATGLNRRAAGGNGTISYAVVLPANLIQAVCFGIYHGNIYQAVYACVIGLIFGFAFLAYGSVVPGMIAHASVNIFGLFMDYIIDPASAKPVKLILMVVMTLAVAAITGKLAVLSKNRQNRLK